MNRKYKKTCGWIGIGEREGNNGLPNNVALSGDGSGIYFLKV